MQEIYKHANNSNNFSYNLQKPKNIQKSPQDTGEDIMVQSLQPFENLKYNSRHSSLEYNMNRSSIDNNNHDINNNNDNKNTRLSSVEYNIDVLNNSFKLNNNDDDIVINILHN